MTYKISDAIAADVSTVESFFSYGPSVESKVDGGVREWGFKAGVRGWEGDGEGEGGGGVGGGGWKQAKKTPTV